MDNKLEYIKSILIKNDYKYTEISNIESLEIIYCLFKNDIINDIKYDDSVIYLYLGVYYCINKKYNEMVTYYKIAIEKGNSYAMYLALHYEKIKDYEQMKKYYLMAIEKGDLDAMNNLAYYYEKIK